MMCTDKQTYSQIIKSLDEIIFPLYVTALLHFNCPIFFCKEFFNKRKRKSITPRGITKNNDLKSSFSDERKRTHVKLNLAFYTVNEFKQTGQAKELSDNCTYFEQFFTFSSW